MRPTSVSAALVGIVYHFIQKITIIYTIEPVYIFYEGLDLFFFFFLVNCTKDYIKLSGCWILAFPRFMSMIFRNHEKKKICLLYTYCIWKIDSWYKHSSKHNLNTCKTNKEKSRQDMFKCVLIFVKNISIIFQNWCLNTMHMNLFPVFTLIENFQNANLFSLQALYFT